MKIGNREFDVKNHSYIMGILNVTPDSFSDGGKWSDEDKVLRRVSQMIEEGADIIDIGGESTRPGHIKISETEEIGRVIPYIELIKKNFDIPVSIDSYKAKVVWEAAKAGVDFINDIWGLKGDDKMAEVIAKAKLPCCIMHNRDNIANPYTSLMDNVLDDLKESIDMALDAGILPDNIVTDPGIGFGKTYEDNLVILNKLEELHRLGYPILLGTSRKSVIGLTLDLPVDERMEGTIATTVLGVMKKCAFIRVHDIKENYRAIKMTEAILNA